MVEGHGVLQPRVSYHLFAATRSRFAGPAGRRRRGSTPTAMAVSDTYMDLFGLGSFTGKGIYDVDAFEAANGHTFPENRILSHDLIEGNYARCGLVTDVELFDDFPPRYHAYALREHRWARGDWQLAPLARPDGPDPDGPRPNPLPDPGALEDPRQPPAEPGSRRQPGVAPGPGLDGPARQRPGSGPAFALAVPALPASSPPVDPGDDL